MKTEVGLWIDHRNAFIVIHDEEGEEIKQINSGMEKHVRFSGEAQAESEEDIRDRRFTNHLNKYYDKVITSLGNASSILVFGPGEAKVELKKRIESDKIKNCSVDIETADKMTDNQIKSKVRNYFLHSDSTSSNFETIK
jgi:stalled ribosome rescue protein Dom34